MANAAIYLHPNGFDTTGKELLGRHSAGESFLRGFLRHADVDRFFMWNSAWKPQAELDALLARIHPLAKPVRWIGSRDRTALQEAGVVNLPHPDLPAEAWRRRPYGGAAFSLCGITHTTATANVMRILPDLLISPTQDHDALICTSNAVHDGVETQLEMVREYLAAEFGPRRRPEPMRVVIPLGVNVDDFATTEEHRRAWREKLDIPDDAVVALYVGRFNVRAKMNPALMALALERAARRTGKTICWVNSGWGPTPEVEAQFHRDSAALCPSVLYRSVDGRPAETRFSIWSVADLFVSFSDNIQETFGLTPVEAMAAGLPCVVTDWNGYKDTVRDGEDGFRIPTIAPAPGAGRDLAYWFDNAWLNYDNYVGAAAQFTALDLDAAGAAIATLVDNPDLRRRMGESAHRRAREVFDWSVIIPQYQALWAEQNARRAAAAPVPPQHDNPMRPDPFRLFKSYPTHHLTADSRIALAPGMDTAAALELLNGPLTAYAAFQRPTQEEIGAVIVWLAGRGEATLRDLLLAIVPQPRRLTVSRGLIWMARYGVLTIHPPAGG
ncbi:glycosyltransferase family 4 protein [Phenylobacterium sp.]|jgi:glycosyltransferase involved in cell wall biosynthesis|uniref:glycosyltransferase family 4 protein n=1 Tax=Phenylobacterium sp. TaxID=1871053 RepID=UPI0037850208